MIPSATNGFETCKIEKFTKTTTINTIPHPLAPSRAPFFIDYIEILKKIHVVHKKPSITALYFYCHIIVKNPQKA